MSKEELKELAATLNGIADGKAWEYCCFTGPKEEWFESMIGTDPMSLLARGQGIRLKPQPDPFVELKAAHAAGKKLQHRRQGESKWSDCSVTDTSQDPYCFVFEPERYRIKPEQQKVPLRPQDVPPGSAFTATDTLGYCCPVLVDEDGCYFASRDDGQDKTVSWEAMADGWQINRSLPLTGKWNPQAWQPCYKLIDKP